MTEPAISQVFGGAAIIALRQPGGPPDAIRPVLCLYCRTDKFVYWPPASRLRLANCPGCQRRARADRDMATLADHREWVPAGRPGAVSHEEAMTELPGGRA
jgi:hypothetical protein